MHRYERSKGRYERRRVGRQTFNCASSHRKPQVKLQAGRAGEDHPIGYQRVREPVELDPDVVELDQKCAAFCGKPVS